MFAELKANYIMRNIKRGDGMNIRMMIGQMEVLSGRPDINTTTILKMLDKARQAEVDLVILPELCISGYLLGDTWEQQAFLRDCESYGQEVIKASQGLTVLFGNVGIDWAKKGADGRVHKYNAFFVAQNGKLLSGEELLEPVHLNLKGQKLALGCLLGETSQPMTALAEKGSLDMFINIACSPFTLGKNKKRNEMFCRLARQSGVPIIYVNNVGIQNNGKTIYTFDGSSAVYDKNGAVIYHYAEPFKQSSEVVELNLASGTVNNVSEQVPPKQEIAYIYQSLIYGIKKFCSSIGLQKVVIGISGGIDSALNAALYAHALGPENTLLVNMPSKYNSQTTKNLARDLAENLNSLYTVIAIQESVDYTLSQLAGTPIINPNSGQTTYLSISSFMAENIQARDRSARILAAVAAAFGGGFSCNANKAETTVGYSTLYGDQAGFLAATADLWKYQVYELANYLNHQVYQREVIPQGIIDIVPSAELSFDQAVDEGKGDPLVYRYHDYLFRSFVQYGNKAAPEDILTWYAEGILEEKLGCEAGLANKIFPAAPEFISDLERWWKQFTGMGVAKRIQAPPILALSPRPFGFNQQEAQNGVYFTRGYLRLKKELISH